jgi:uncharacterized OsmC-like protein
MPDVKYTSRVRLIRDRGPLRRAWIPAEAEPVTFGVHDEVAEHYGVDPGAAPAHATTLDYVVAAAAGLLTGTLGGALEARGIDASGGRLESFTEGDVEVEDRVLVIKRLRVRYRLTGCPEERREAAERAHSLHASRCPVARSIGGCIAIATELEFV